MKEILPLTPELKIIENDVNSLLYDIYEDNTTLFQMQREEWDCGICTMAHVLNKKYEDIYTNFMSTYSVKNIVNTTQKGISYHALIAFLNKNHIQTTLLETKVQSIDNLPKIDLTKSYVVILVDRDKQTHFVFIKDGILYDSEIGICDLEDATDFREYINNDNDNDYSGWVKYKYLTQIH